MSWPWNQLAIESTDDRRVIKRAYAKLLKTTRPDEQPEEFQALHEAYQAALSYAESGYSAEPGDDYSGSASGAEDDSVAADTVDTFAIREDDRTEEELAPQPESHRFLEHMHSLLDAEAPFADLSVWEALLTDYQLDDFESSQQASYGAFHLLSEFAWDNRRRLRRRGPFGQVLRQFDERFDWSEQELELLQQFPVETADNLLKRLSYSGERLTRVPEGAPQSTADRRAGNGFYWFFVAFLVLQLLFYIAR